jgi:hypothetical protein
VEQLEGFAVAGGGEDLRGFFVGRKGGTVHTLGAQGVFDGMRALLWLFSSALGDRGVSSARIVGAPLVVVEGAVELKVAAAREALEAAFVPDLHGVAEDRIVAQLDRERAKEERDLEEFFTECDRAVLAHDAFGAGVKKRGDFVGVLDVAHGLDASAEAFVRCLAGGAVDAKVVGGGGPT